MPPEITAILNIIDKLGNFGFAAIACGVMFLIYRLDQIRHEKELKELFKQSTDELSKARDAFEKQLAQIRDDYIKTVEAQNARYVEQISRSMNVIEANTEVIKSFNETNKAFVQIGTILLGELGKIRKE